MTRLQIVRLSSVWPNNNIMYNYASLIKGTRTQQDSVTKYTDSHYMIHIEPDHVCMHACHDIHMMTAFVM